MIIKQVLHKKIHETKLKAKYYQSKALKIILILFLQKALSPHLPGLLRPTFWNNKCRDLEPCRNLPSSRMLLKVAQATIE
jgi:hypothetical protein